MIPNKLCLFAACMETRERKRALFYNIIKNNYNHADLLWMFGALCAKRLGFYKDVRNVISRMIWNDRHLGLYL